MTIPSRELADGKHIPLLGLGTYQLPGEEVIRPLEMALEVGYRHIDTAERYHNQIEIGGVLTKSHIPREELFITSKVWRENLTREKLIESCDRILQELRTDYLDLLLIHWPNRDIPLAETMGALDYLRLKGIVRSIGVSNFTRHHIQDVLTTGITPVINQVEIHPSFGQPELRSYCQEHQIAVTAYAPLAQGQDLQLPTVQALAKKYQVSCAQAILNWILAKNMITIPRSSKKENLEDNLRAVEWKMEAADLEEMDSLNSTNRLFNFSFSEFDY